ncbi:hypothetical protein Defa_19410 [Desulfovibrio sp. TH_2024_36128]|uniref:Uncharacterized protein n=1 Tax=Desulfovibrio falkowii TaxID=3136602 RepID=A0ABQ0E9K3_9BACT
MPFPLKAPACPNAVGRHSVCHFPVRCQKRAKQGLSARQDTATRQAPTGAEKYRRPAVHKETAGRRCLLGANAMLQAYIRAA